ncbi:sulfolipid-1 biosynthesis phthioceranic/hydroxyphthioceranic acid synthase [Mycolicibacterium vaccae]|uniref:sulfolipid-1 biosynthesis phthioceranic/hydroxyphthioceranic acid synthase n=1 Tax=Mycolicibacterium vaccae TaxID=1810 RepID=UPI003D0000F2
MRRTPAVPVAVIGMACRLPGGIDSPEQFWEALLRGDDLVTEIPPGRWDAEEYFDPEPGVPGRSVSKWGGFLSDFAGFDAEFFGITEREATAIDPQHRLLLETAWEAVEHAGIAPPTLGGSQTGVFMGLTHNDYTYLAADTGALEGPYGFTGTSFSLASGRIAYALNTRGPAVTVDTACSSSLSAIHLACQSLADGDSDMALAGGVSVLLEPRKAAGGSAAGMLSATGRCHAFDVEADGFVSAEGSVVIALKRLDDAIAAGDRVLGVIRGTATNQDGRTVNISTPSSEAQAAVYRSALAVAGIDASTVGLVEAHGTGTPVGDPIEYSSVAEVYGIDTACALGSAKTNFGHAQSAAGALGLMKAVLAVQHGVIPRNLHFGRLPAELEEIKTQLFVPLATSAWPVYGDHPRRAAVSAYGLSGTNVHAIVEQAPAVLSEEPPLDVRPRVFPLSASSGEELRRTAGRLADWLAKNGDGNGLRDDSDLGDLGYTLARRRGHRAVRTSVIAEDRDELISALRDIGLNEATYPSVVATDDRGPVWVFSGQGSQWAGMGAELLAREPVFAATIAELEPLIAAESGFSVTEAMTAPEVVTGIDRVQPVIFAIQVALAAAMKAHGVRPGAVVGHSMGEAAAAVVAEALTLEDAVKVICRRSRLMATISGSGAMASVELPAKQVLSELAARGIHDVVLSVVASPQSTVVGGSRDAVRALVADWEERGVMAREVAVDVASHSPQVDSILDDLIDELADLEPQDPAVPYYSATLYDPREIPFLDADYWADNLRHTVRFASAVQAALEDGHRVFAELSPHPLLTHAVEQIARPLDIRLAAIAGMRREQQMPYGLLELVADLHNEGAALDFSAMYPSGQLIDAPLPTWNHVALELRRDDHELAGRHGPVVSVHPMLGSHVVLPEEPERHVWQGEVGTDALPWLAEHSVHDVAVLPGAGFCEMALTAARTVFGEHSAVRDITFEDMLLLEPETPVSAWAELLPGDAVEFVVETHGEGERTRRSFAELQADSVEQPDDRDIEALLSAHSQRVDGADLRSAFHAAGVYHGPAFAGMAWAATPAEPNRTVLAEIALPGPLRSHQNGYCVHPALLDACFQSVMADPEAQNASGLLLPLGVRRLRAFAPTRTARYCYSHIVSVDSDGIEADLEVLDEHGAILLSATGLRLGTGGGAVAQADRLLNQRLLAVEWQERVLPDADTADAGSWLVLDISSAGTGLAGDLGAALSSAGAESVVTAWSPSGDTARSVAELEAHLAEKHFDGVVLVDGTAGAAVDRDTGVRGGEHVRHLVHVCQALCEMSARLYLVTRNAQVVLDGDVPNLEQAGVRGFARAIGMEYPRLSVTQIDVDDAPEPRSVAAQIISRSDEDETAWRDGRWFTARLYPAPLHRDERHKVVVHDDSAGVRLCVGTPGDLESLELVSFERTPPGPGQIEVAVRASSINFADVLVAFGRCPSYDGRLPELGSEFAGVVTAVGPDVTTHKVGDRVGGVSPNGCWGTFVSCDARLATTLPDGLDDRSAAAIGLAYATVWLGLQELARIRAGDKVLIHSATGGVGQAAIAVARAAGAEIFATAGSEERRQLLRDWGIEHVYDSRTAEFAEQIRRQTDGYGVDIVLNSLTGVAQRAGLELLAFGGRFIEIGKRDIYADTRLGLFPFRRNLSFHAVDLALMTVTHPDQLRRLLDTVYRRVADGELPRPDVTTYPLDEAATAIRQIAGAKHTGKLVLDVPHTGSPTAAVLPEDVPVFRPDGSYLVTGGLGGLGLFLAEKMAAAGCGRIVLTSRSEPSSKAREIIEMIRASGADIAVVCGDITDRGTVDRLVEAATATGLPLRGVLHAAAVVEDATLVNITDDLLGRDWAPKVHGAWNLHEATLSEQLDWFCAFSSAAALVGSPGQSAYASANSWLDAFMRWRSGQGLPATTIAWGAWSEIGLGTKLADGDAAIEPDEGARALEALLRHNRVYSGYAPILGTPWLATFAQRSPFAEAFRSGSQDPTETRKLLGELAALPREEWPTHLRRLIAEQVGLLLRRPVDPDRPLSEYGLDSLGSLELRTRIEAETGVRVGAMDMTTVRALAQVLCDKLTADEATAAAS